jgi:hypothetical protein
MTACPDSGGFGDPPRDGKMWKQAQGEGAQDSWLNDLRPDCNRLAGARVVSVLLRFNDSATAGAFFAHEKATASTNAIFWPTGGKSTEGAATGFGASSVAVEYGGVTYCVFWIHATIASNYCTVAIGAADSKKGALAVDARIPT